MSRPYFFLLIALGFRGLLGIPEYARATSGGRASALSSPAHSYLDSSWPTETPMLASSTHARSHVPSEPSEWGTQSAITGNPNVLGGTSLGGAGSSAERRAPLSPHGIGDTLNGIMETVKSLSEDIQRLSKETFERLSRIELAQETLRELVHKSAATTGLTLTKVEASITDKIVKVKEDIAALSSSVYVANSRSRRFFFHVENITQHVENAKLAGSQVIFGDKFTIDGYTAQLLLHVGPSKKDAWLLVFLRICPGTEDSHLQWPFRTNFVLSVVHLDDPAESVYNTIDSKTADCPTSFDKPEKECNTVCGFPEAESWAAIEQGGYVHKGALTVGVTFL
ncbi:uncharacterized protein LOC135369342 [Ornithodoros turicata]|uniref:uncharacterized protein LOC135369342 n=1 Tax=Ornithodoros turicata TaxID=34597 RepID=UPI003139B922